MLKDKRHVFWQALLIAILVFALGLVFGVYIEQIRADKSNILFFDSESSLFDTLAMINFLDNSNLSCSDLVSSQISFADRIYYEAKQLENYDESSKLTDSLKSIHKKYDLLRTILWINSMKIKQKCPSYNDVVYLYHYETEDISIKAKQDVWAKVLSELKDNEGDKIVLIPISVDGNLSSLNEITSKYNIEEYPVVIINEKDVINNLSSAGELEKYLKD